MISLQIAFDNFFSVGDTNDSFGRIPSFARLSATLLYIP